MDRRTFLKSSGAATVGGLTTAHATNAQASQATETRTLSITTTPSAQGDSAALIVRRFSEAIKAATDAALTCDATADGEAADITLSSILARADTHPAWATLLPLVNGFDEPDFAGWLATGGGASILEQLESETDVKILLVGAIPTPHGLWADRELFGLHPRPSLTVQSIDQAVLSHQEVGTGNLTCVLSNGLVADLEADKLTDLILHALPTRVAGEPLVLTMPMTTWTSLTAAEQTLMTALADASLARSINENRVAARMAQASIPLPSPIPLPHEFQLALSAAVEAKRNQLSADSSLAADSLASQAAYRAVTRASDLTRTRRPLAS